MPYLTSSQVEQYRNEVKLAFPQIIHASPIIKNYWHKIESFFPEHQLFAIDEDHSVIGIINSIPIYWNTNMKELPEAGWDWLVKKGIFDYEQNLTPNTLGGLQIIVSKSNLGKGYSKRLVAALKNLKLQLGYKNLIIPIRPTLKSYYPEMAMHDYLNFKKEGQIFDPWIRTHVKSGARIIKVCKKSMHIHGDLSFWLKLLNKDKITSGKYVVHGALNEITVNVEENYGEYCEENIWIEYL